jgi:hypothetical protein
MLNIIHVAGKKDPTKFYEAVSSISPMPKGIVCPPQINETFVFDFENFDKAKFDTLPQFIREMIVTSNEYKLLHGLEPQEIPLKSAVDAYQSKKEEPEDDELLF